MNQNQHARTIADRFKEIFEQSGETFSQDHHDELVLLIESGLDAALYQHMEKVADKLGELAHDIRHNAEFTTED